jgi:two-component system chemotaxis response regulator CheY
MAKILIIDDEIKLRETIRELLSFTGYDVIEAQNGEEGLQKVKEFLPDLIMCDIMMPVLDGYGFLKAHLLSDYSDIPVIFATAIIPLRDQKKAFALGVKGYFKKPFIYKELLEAITEHINP